MYDFIIASNLKPILIAYPLIFIVVKIKNSFDVF